MCVLLIWIDDISCGLGFYSSGVQSAPAHLSRHIFTFSSLHSVLSNTMLEDETFWDTLGDVCASLLNIETVNLRLQVRGDQGGQRGQGVRVCHLYHLGHGDPGGDR